MKKELRQEILFFYSGCHVPKGCGNQHFFGFNPLSHPRHPSSEEIWHESGPEGVIRSPAAPAEATGVTLSGGVPNREMVWGVVFLAWWEMFKRCLQFHQILQTVMKWGFPEIKVPPVLILILMALSLKTIQRVG